MSEGRAAGEGPIIVTALLGDEDFAWLDELRRLHYPVARNQVAAHLTLFHHLPPSLERELAQRLAGHALGPPPHARIAGIMDLGIGTAFRVESAELEDIREDLAAALHGLLTPQDRGPWSAHVTIQNKADPRDAHELQARLRSGFAPRPLAIKGLATWRYKGGPWEEGRRYLFRG